MKIFNINFIQNNFAKSTKHNNNSSLAPLSYDTVTFGSVTFGANRPKNIPYSIYQKDDEIKALESVLNKAIQNGEVLDAEALSKRSGLDIYVVKLRLSTSSKIKELCIKMEAAQDAKAENKKQADTQNLKLIFEAAKVSGQKLTESEIAFYLGIDKGETPKLLKKASKLPFFDENSILKEEQNTLIERKTQTANINQVFKQRLAKKDTLTTVAKKTKLPPETLRARLNENSEMFQFAMENKLYPPEIFQEKEIEIQEAVLMRILSRMLRNNISFDINYIAARAELPPGIVQIRLNTNEALNGLCNRILGANEDGN